MKINLVSDLHDDIARNRIGSMPPVDADATVVAGDAMAPGVLALRRIRELYPDRSRPLIYPPGNHDFYSEHDPRRPELKVTWEQCRIDMRAVAEELGIILLDDDVAHVEVAGEVVRFVGGTLWSDFITARPGYVDMAEAVRSAARQMNDYRLIKTGEGRSRDKLMPRDTIAAHRATVSFVERVLSTPFDGDTVLCTHHAPALPSLRGWDPERPDNFNNLDWCYASDLSRWFTGDGMGPNHVPPTLAVHGHIHIGKDYRIGQTRIVANPRGYPGPGLSRENPDFDPALVIEIGGYDLTPTYGM